MATKERSKTEKPNPRRPSSKTSPVKHAQTNAELRQQLAESLQRESASASTQSWNEWTRSWGMSLRFPGGDLRYRGSLTTGGRRPGVDTPDGVILEDALSSSRPGFAVPFRSFVTTTFDDVRVTVHQISLSVGLR